MKNLFLFTLILFAFLPFNSSAQLVFGVSPGLNLNGAYIGTKFSDHLIGTFGFQYLGVSYTLTDPDFEDKFSGSVFIPSLGLKYLMNKQNQIQPYLGISVSKPFVTGKIEYDGEEDEEFSDAVKNLSLLGLELGFGVEYFFDENFSIGGEYGFRYINVKYKSSDEFDDVDVSGSVKPTYTKLTLNYYFSKGGE